MPVAHHLLPFSSYHRRSLYLCGRYSEKLGFLGTCPSNLGTGLRASVMIKLAKFNETEESRQVLEQVRTWNNKRRDARTATRK